MHAKMHYKSILLILLIIIGLLSTTILTGCMEKTKCDDEGNCEGGSKEDRPSLAKHIQEETAPEGQNTG